MSACENIANGGVTLISMWMAKQLHIQIHLTNIEASKKMAFVRTNLLHLYDLAAELI